MLLSITLGMKWCEQGNTQNTQHTRLVLVKLVTFVRHAGLLTSALKISLRSVSQKQSGKKIVRLNPSQFYKSLRAAQLPSHLKPIVLKVMSLNSNMVNPPLDHGQVFDGEVRRMLGQAQDMMPSIRSGMLVIECSHILTLLKTQTHTHENHCH